MAVKVKGQTQSKHSQRSKMELSALVVDYFHKRLHLRYLTGCSYKFRKIHKNSHLRTTASDLHLLKILEKREIL